MPDTRPSDVIRVEVAAPGLSAERVERDVTIPIERALHALPRLRSVASRSQEGLSTVELSFDKRPSPQDEGAVAGAVSKLVATMQPWASVQRISIEAAALR